MRCHDQFNILFTISQCLIVNWFFSSLVGYIVGLGDRHVQNILVDCNTAELVHIDLGKEERTAKVLLKAPKLVNEVASITLHQKVEFIDLGVAGILHVCMLEAQIPLWWLSGYICDCPWFNS